MARNKEPAVKALNFKALYNKQYGEYFRINQQCQLTPEQLFDMAVRYFEWAETNHIQAAETASFQGDVFESKTHKPRVFTIVGFRLFCGFTENNIQRWRKEPGYADVMEFVDSVIREQKFQLAANNMVNASLVSKDLGLDKPTTITVENNANNSIEAVSADDVKEAVRDILDAI